MSIQIVRIILGDVKPNYHGDILAFVPGIKEFQALHQNVMKLMKKFGCNIEVQFMHSRFSEETK
jgi:HrpA-like RNA helicase